MVTGRPAALPDDPAAVLAGWDCYAMARLLDELSRGYDGGGAEGLMVAARRAGLRDEERVLVVVAALRRAAVRWARSLVDTRTSATGSAEVVGAEVGAPCGEDDTLSTTEAATMLHLTARQVRHLAADERLGSRVGRTWRFTRAEVLAELDRRSAA